MGTQEYSGNIVGIYLPGSLYPVIFLLQTGLLLAGNGGMEKKMETTVLVYILLFKVYGSAFRRNGKEHGNYYNGLLYKL